MSVELCRGVCRVDGGGDCLGSNYCKPNQGIPDLSYPPDRPGQYGNTTDCEAEGGGNSRFEQQKESHVVIGMQAHTVPLFDSDSLETCDELTDDFIGLRG
jgi:hypothetical protein